MNGDSQLLLNLAEDVPDMALEIRERLRGIAAMLDNGHRIGEIRCERCGWRATVDIRTATGGSAS